MRRVCDAQFAAAGGFRDLDGDSSMDELNDVGGGAHHRGGLPSLMPVSTDVSGSSSPTRFGGDDSPALREAYPLDYGSGPLSTSADMHDSGGGGFGSPFTGGLPLESRAFSAGLPPFSGLAAPAGPRFNNGLHTLSAPLNALPQASFPSLDAPQAAHVLVLLQFTDALMCMCRARGCDAKLSLEPASEVLQCGVCWQFCPAYLDLMQKHCVRCRRAWCRWISRGQVSCPTRCICGTSAARSACRCR